MKTLHFQRNMMFQKIKTIYVQLQEAGFRDPLEELLQLLDDQTEGGVRAADADFAADLPVSLEELLERRLAGEPLAYILGRVPFMGLMFQCRPGALIPRAETELLVRAVLARMPVGAAPTVIDMCTGSGNIAVALAAHHAGCRVHGTDISETAVALARIHAADHHLTDRVTFYCGDMFAPLAAAGLQDSADIVVCNPPYIPTKSLEKLDPTIRDHEPEEALNAGPYGIDFFRRLIQDAPRYLRPGGLLAFEIGAGQERFVGRLLKKSADFADPETYTDAAGTPRGFLITRK
jgi:release factor glutamine methyltransferase